jgi:hypothetical protein
LIAVLLHLFLTAFDSSFATEGACIVALSAFVVAEILLGIGSVFLTLIGLLFVTPLMVIEAARSPSGPRGSRPTYANPPPEYMNSRCVSHSVRDLYHVLAAIRITGIPQESVKKQEKEPSNLLYPIWSDGRESGTNHCLEATLRDGLAEITWFVSCRHKEQAVAFQAVLQSISLVETYLSKQSYGYRELDFSEILSAVNELDCVPLRAMGPSIALAENKYVGALQVRIQNPDASISAVINELLEKGIAGRLLFSFKSTDISRISRPVDWMGIDTEQTQRIPFKLQDHHHRMMYKEIEHVQLCEKLGSFRTGILMACEEDSPEAVSASLAKASAAFLGVWGDAESTRISGRGLARVWDSITLRDCMFRSFDIHGGTLSQLIRSKETRGVASKAVVPDFAIPERECDSEGIHLGRVLHRGRPTEQRYFLSAKNLCNHTAIYGNTGSGKTNTAFNIVRGVHDLDIPFLAIVPAKTEWRRMLGHIPSLRLFTVGDERTAPFRFNMFDVPQGVPIQSHISNITTCFVATWPSEGILTEHIAKVFRRTYQLADWDPYTDRRGRPILLLDLYQAMTEVTRELKYGARLKQDFIGALTARFESLLDDPVLSMVLNTEEGVSVEELLESRTILELRHLPDAQRALVTSLVLATVTEYLEAQSMDYEQRLRCLLILEEAHHVLKRVPNTGLHDGHSAQQQAIDSLVQLLREARGLGLGVMVIDQLPGNLADSVVKLPGNTIIHSLKDPRERILVGGQANLSEEQLMYAGLMPCGEAIVHQGFSGNASHIIMKLLGSDRKTKETWTDERVADLMESYFNERPQLRLFRRPEYGEWQPNETLLWNLRYIVDSEEFLKEYEKRSTTGQEFADAYLKGLVSRFVESPKEIRLYSETLHDYISSPKDGSKEEQGRAIGEGL